MEGVCQQVTLAMLTKQPLEMDFFPGILEGLVSRLGLAPPGATNPPNFIKEGITQCWVTALRDAVKEMEVRGPEQDLFDPASHGLHLDYNMYF